MRLVTVVVEPLSGVKPIFAKAEEIRADHNQIGRRHQRNAPAGHIAMDRHDDGRPHADHSHNCGMKIRRP